MRLIALKERDHEMPFKKRDAEREEKELQELIDNYEDVRRTIAEYEADVAFRKALIAARKAEDITQSGLSRKTGLSQQAISRIETGSGNTTIQTLIKYLRGIGYELQLKRKEEGI